MGEAAERVVLAGVVIGRLALLGLWFGGLSLLANHLSQEAMGFFALSVTFIQVFSSFIGDTLDLAILRRVPVELISNRPRAIRVLRTAFVVRLAIGLLVCAVTSAFSPFIAEVFFGGPDQWLLVVLAGVGVVGDLLSRSALVYFQAAGSFRRLLLLDAGLQGGRFTVVLGLILTGQLTAMGAILTQVSVPFLVFFLAMLLFPPRLLRFGRRAFGKLEVRDVLHFSKWMILALAIAAVSERLELFLIGYFLDAAAAGVYFAALILAARIPELLEGVMATVFMPRVSQSSSEGRFREMQRAYTRWAITPAIAVVLGALWLGPWVIPLVFGESYTAAVPLVQGMLLGSMAWLALAPLASPLVAFRKPQAMVAINLTGLLFRAVAGATLIPWLGLAGGATIFVVVNWGMTIAVLVIAWHLTTPERGGTSSLAGTEPDGG